MIIIIFWMQSCHVIIMAPFRSPKEKEGKESKEEDEVDGGSIISGAIRWHTRDPLNLPLTLTHSHSPFLGF